MEYTSTYMLSLCASQILDVISQYHRYEPIITKAVRHLSPMNCYRIPISKTHPIEDNYLWVIVFLLFVPIFLKSHGRDAYVRVLLRPEADAQGSSLLFSCGMGAVRTTFAMCAATIVRRRQLILQGSTDPYGLDPSAGASSTSNDENRSSTVLVSVLLSTSS